MARTRRGEEEEQDLNLAPIMNLVIILIPLLLLSVVFLQVGVINVTAPKLSVGPPTEKEEPEDPPLNLTVAISPNGLNIAATNANPELDPSCPPTGPNICLADRNVEVGAKIKEARSMMGSGNIAEGEDVLDAAIAAYDWPQFYNTLTKIKENFPEETILTIAADADIPFALIVKTMDVARYKLDKDTYDSAAALESAKIRKKGAEPEELFPDPILSIAK